MTFRRLTDSAAAGFIYAALAFAAGFALGTLRTIVIAPRLGELGAVALELPAMLFISWLACGFAIRRTSLPPTAPLRVFMGIVAFLLLMGAEFALAHFAFARSMDEFLAALQTAPGALGLAGQIAFALMPLIRR